jgi:hypothetical protein
MLTIVLVAVLLCLALAGVIVFMNSRLAKARGEIWGAEQHEARAIEAREAAEQKIRNLQRRCRELGKTLDASVHGTAAGIDAVSEQLRQLLALAGDPLDAGLGAHRREIPAEEHAAINGHGHVEHPPRYQHPYPEPPYPAVQPHHAPNPAGGLIDYLADREA